MFFAGDFSSSNESVFSAMNYDATSNEVAYLRSKQSQATSGITDAGCKSFLWKVAQDSK